MDEQNTTPTPWEEVKSTGDFSNDTAADAPCDPASNVAEVSVELPVTEQAATDPLAAEPEAFPENPAEAPAVFNSYYGQPASVAPQQVPSSFDAPVGGQPPMGYPSQVIPPMGYGAGGYPGGVAPILPNQPKKKNIGLLVFFAVLIGVVLAAGGLTAGYYVLEYFSQDGEWLDPPTSYSDSIDVQIQEKPMESGDGRNEDGSYTVQKVVEKVKDSVVSIRVYSPDGSSGSSATGVILSEDGYVLTNDHIYKEIPNAKFRITLNNGEEYVASFVAGDTRSDIAVLKIKDAPKLQAATFGKSAESKVGEQVVAIGNSAGLVDTVTVGYISALNRRISGTTNYNSKYIQTDTAINPGNSGGPLVNLYGQVIGINSSKIAEVSSEGICFAIPIDEALSIVKNLMANGRVVGRAKLGITYHEINSVMAEIIQYPTGLYIATISEDSDLHGKDISQGDIITHINGQEITSGNQVLDVIEAAHAGDTVTLTVYKIATESSVQVATRLVEYVGGSSYTTSDSNSSAPSTSRPDSKDEDGFFLEPNW